MAEGAWIVTDADNVFGTLSIRLRHNSASVVELSRLLGMPTAHEWRATDVLYRGPKLPSRPRGQNYWASEFVLRAREFADAIRDVVEALVVHREALGAFTMSGGRIELCLQLNGKHNSGDCLGPDLLGLIGALGVEFQIEVFPNIGI